MSHSWFNVTIVAKKRDGASFLPVPDVTHALKYMGPPRRMRRGRKDPSVYVPTYGRPEDDFDLSEVFVFEPCRVCGGSTIDWNESGRCAEHT